MKAGNYWRGLTEEEQERWDKDVNELIDTEVLRAMEVVIKYISSKLPPEVDAHDFSWYCVRNIASIHKFIEDLRPARPDCEGSDGIPW